MLNDYVKLGQRVELKALTRVKLNGEEPESKVYSSKVYDILSDERLELLMPYEQTKLVVLQVDTEYELYFYSDTGLYECVAKIVDRYRSNNVYVMVMELTRNLRKFQRREYYRFSCALDILTREMTEVEIESMGQYVEEGLSLQKGILVDISGGGIRFVSDYKYEKGTLVYCRYELKQKIDEKAYEIMGKVLDVKPLEKRPGNYEHRVQYLNIPKEKREEIIRYIFEEERKSQKKKKEL